MEQDWGLWAEDGSTLLWAEDGSTYLLQEPQTLAAEDGTTILTDEAGSNDLVNFSAVTYTMTASAGAYVLTGNAANFDLLNPNALLSEALDPLTAEDGTTILLSDLVGTNYTIFAAGGIYTLLGNEANFVSRVFTRNIAEASINLLAPYGANLMFDRRMTADAGTYSLGGNPAGLQSSTAQRSMFAERGTYALTGNDAGLQVSGQMVAAQGSYTLTGSDVTFATGRSIAMDPGVYALTGSDVEIRNLRLQADPGIYTLAGKPADLRANIRSTKNGGDDAPPAIDIRRWWEEAKDEPASSQAPPAPSKGPEAPSKPPKAPSRPPKPLPEVNIGPLLAQVERNIEAMRQQRIAERNRTAMSLLLF